MLAGHLAAGLAAKKAAPRARLPALVRAAYGMDLLWPVLVLLGAETVRIEPGSTAFTPLAFESYPWSHSLATTLVAGGVLGAVSLGLTRRIQESTMLGLAWVSHWVLDFVSHGPDLPLWPGGPRVGLGLWESVPATFFVEGILLAIGLWLYLSVTRPEDRTGSIAFFSLVGFVTLIWILGPFAPPPPGPASVAVVGLGLFLLPAWAAWADRHRGVVRRPD